MNSEELEEHLNARKASMSESEYFELILDMLEKETSEDSRKILEAQLIVNSLIAPDKAALYFEAFLDDPDEFKRELVALKISIVSIRENPAGSKILKRYLGEEFVEGQESEIILERLRKLFPGYSEEDPDII